LRSHRLAPPADLVAEPEPVEREHSVHPDLQRIRRIARLGRAFEDRDIGARTLQRQGRTRPGAAAADDDDPVSAVRHPGPR
jgi:hypothetical protein